MIGVFLHRSELIKNKIYSISYSSFQYRMGSVHKVRHSYQWCVSASLILLKGWQLLYNSSPGGIPRNPWKPGFIQEIRGGGGGWSLRTGGVLGRLV